MNILTVKEILIAVLLAGVFYAGYAFRGIEVEELKSEHSLFMKNVAEAVTASTLEAKHKLEEQVSKAAQVEQRNFEELKNAQDEIKRLHGDVVAGNRRLSVKANCPAKVSGAVTDTKAGGLGDGESPGLTEDARRNYWDLRAGISTVTKQLNACQEYVTEVVK